VTPGTNASFSLEVNNIGTAAAQNVTVTHAFTATSATLVSSSSTLGSCSARGNTVSCNLGSMAAGATATISIALNITAPVLNRSFVVATDGNQRLIPSLSPANFLAKLKTMTSPAAASAIVQDSFALTSASTPPASSAFTPLGIAAGGATGNTGVISGDGTGAVVADRAPIEVPALSVTESCNTISAAPAANPRITPRKICTGP
jgi:hypothetical protein